MPQIGDSLVFDSSGDYVPLPEPLEVPSDGRVTAVVERLTPDPHPVKVDWLAPPEQDGEIGRLGPYRIFGILGSGAMGIVLRAEDTQLRRPVALKVLHPARADLEVARQRFFREARAAAALKHDHVVTVYQVGEDRGVPFLAMELLKGESLEERLYRLRRLPVPEVLRIGREMALGLSAAHAQNMIHRDIKPANVWLEGESGRVKILDFGLARLGGEVHLTAAGIVVGTPAYMAPEQATGKDLDPRADLFSLGAVLYELLTGELPFKGSDTLGVLCAIANEKPIPPDEIDPTLPPSLCELILHLLAKDRRYRPGSIRAVVDALRQIEEEEREGSAPAATFCPSATLAQPEVSGAMPPGHAQPPGRRTSRQRAGLCFAVVFFITLLAGWLLLAPSPATFPRPLRSAGQAHRATRPPSLDDLRPDDIPAPLLAAAGGGRRESAPEGLVAVWPAAPSATAVTALAFSPAGDMLACGTRQGKVCLLAVPTGEQLRQFEAHGRMIKHLAFRPDGKVLATSASDGQVRLWSTDRFERTATYPAADGDSRPLAFSGDGKLLAAGSRGEKGGSLHWHPTRPDLSAPPGPAANRFGVTALAFGPGGFLAAGDADRHTVRIWGPRTGTAPRSVSPAPGQAASSLAFNPDGTRLAGTFPGMNAVRVWKAATGQQLLILEDRPKRHNGRGPQHVAIGPDNQTLAAVTSPGVIRLWDLKTGKLVRQVRLSPAVQDVYQIAFSDDGRHLATANSNGTVYILRLGEFLEQS